MKQAITILAFLLIIGVANSQTKKQPQNVAQRDTTLFYLAGDLKDFQLLYLAIKSPQDITPRQDTALLRWIETIRKLESDSSGIKR